MTAFTRTEEFAAAVTGLEVYQKIRKECEADIVIGIPTYNNARTIRNVLLAVQTGLACYFPDLKAVIVTADGGSRDGTPAIARNSVVRKIPVFISHCGTGADRMLPDPYHPFPGRADAFRAIFQTAEELDARACVFLDAGVTSMTPAWIQRLISPVLEHGSDHVSPLYLRTRSDSLITNTILYPLIRALYGKRVRQPVGGNFCVSGRLARFHLRKMAEEADRAPYGIEVSLLTAAIMNDFRIAQAFLGLRVRDNSGRRVVHAVLPGIMDAVFGLVASDHHVWKSVRGSEPVTVFGSETGTATEQARVEVGSMLALFRQGVRDLKDIWISIIGPDDFRLLEYIAFRPEGRFMITPMFWARIVYAYAIAYHRKNASPRHLLPSLIPLYLGKAASHLLEVQDKGPQETEEEIERLCLAFEDGKDYLARNWRT